MGQRIVYIDLVKGFTIFLVVWGHVVQSFGINSSINYWINLNIAIPFHMPLFAMLSGMFLNERYSLKEGIERKIRQILVPHIFWCVILFLVIPNIISLINGEHIYIYASFRNLYYGFINWGFWFLRALFLSYVFAIFSINLYKRAPLLCLSVSIIVLYSLGWSGIIPNMNGTLKGFFFLYPFFIIGKVFRTYESKFDIYQKQILICSLVAFAFGVYLWRGWPDTFYDMNTSLVEPVGHEGIVGIEVLKRSLLRFCLGLSGSFITIYAFKFLCNTQILETVPMKFLDSIGRKTLAIYVLHSFAIIYIPARNLWNHQVLVVPACILISLLLIASSCWVYSLTSKNKFLALVLWGKL